MKILCNFTENLLVCKIATEANAFLKYLSFLKDESSVKKFVKLGLLKYFKFTIHVHIHVYTENKFKYVFLTFAKLFLNLFYFLFRIICGKIHLYRCERMPLQIKEVGALLDNKLDFQILTGCVQRCRVRK